MENNQNQLLEGAQATLAAPAWRREPEIDHARQEFLRQRLAIKPDIQRSIYPFKDTQLTRADLEWLLATHEQGRGPIDWSDPSQRRREGLDLRGADLQRVNLRGLPLACLRGGLTQEERVATTPEQRALAGIYLEHAGASEAHLEGAILRGAFLQNASLRLAHMEKAILFNAHLEQAHLRSLHLEGANMMYAHLEGTYLRNALLTGADLRHAYFDSASTLENVTLSDTQWGSVRLADIHWNDCNLSLINWRRISLLGDEAMARALSTREDSK